jgi:hypothetical protein
MSRQDTSQTIPAQGVGWSKNPRKKLFAEEFREKRSSLRGSLPASLFQPRSSTRLPHIAHGSLLAPMVAAGPSGDYAKPLATVRGVASGQSVWFYPLE